jgi:metal-sulfur cluster biosynthetic enzyme
VQVKGFRMENFYLEQDIQRLLSDVEVKIFKVKMQFDERWTAERKAMKVKHQDWIDGCRAEWDKKMKITLDSIEMVQGQIVAKVRDFNVAFADHKSLINDIEEFAAGVPKIRQRTETR